MTFEVALFARHELRYTTDEPVPVKDVITMLQGLQRISTRFLPRTLTALTGIEVISAELYVQGGSFVECVLVKLVFGSKEQLDAFLTKANEGVIADAQGFIVKHPMVSTAVLALLVYGAAQAYGAMNEGKTSPSIQANSNVINIIGAESYKMDPEEFARVVAVSVGPGWNKLTQDVAKVLAPAKNESVGIMFDGNERLNVSADAIRAVPAIRLLRLRFLEIGPRGRLPSDFLPSIATRSTRAGRDLISGFVDHRVPMKLSIRSIPRA